MSRVGESPAVVELLLTPLEAARSLKICEKTLQKIKNAGGIAYVPFGRSVRFSVDELKAYIARNSVLACSACNS